MTTQKEAVAAADEPVAWGARGDAGEEVLVSTLRVMWPCAVCKRPTEPCCPLSICDKCRDSPQAEIVRLEYRVDFLKLRVNHYSDEIDALESYGDLYAEARLRVLEDAEAKLRADMVKIRDNLEWIKHHWNDSDAKVLLLFTIETTRYGTEAAKA